MKRCACGAPLPLAAHRCFACAADRVRDAIAWSGFQASWGVIGRMAFLCKPLYGIKPPIIDRDPGDES
jgi:hypothetical protein